MLVLFQSDLEENVKYFLIIIIIVIIIIIITIIIIVLIIITYRQTDRQAKLYM